MLVYGHGKIVFSYFRGAMLVKSHSVFGLPVLISGLRAWVTHSRDKVVPWFTNVSLDVYIF